MILTYDTPRILQALIREYNRSVGGIKEDETYNEDRAYGGVIRAAKGKLVEEMTEHILQLAWQKSGGSPNRLTFGDTKTFRVPIQFDYIDRLSPEIRDYINA